MNDTLDQRHYERGYEERMCLLRDHGLSLADVLNGRVHHAERNIFYAEGAERATEDFIDQLEQRP